MPWFCGGVILKGKGKVVIKEEEKEVTAHDLVFIPKNTPYNLIGKMKYFLVCSPAFDPSHDLILN